MIKKTIILLLFFLSGLTHSSAQKKNGLLKIDLDTTVIYVDFGVVMEMSKGDIPDSVQRLWSTCDTIVCKDLKTLACRNQTIEFDIRKALVKILRKHYAEVYFKGEKIEQYMTVRYYTRKKHDVYHYTYLKTNKEFLRVIMFQRYSADGNPSF